MAKNSESPASITPAPKAKAAPPSKSKARPSANGRVRAKSGGPEVRVRMYRHGLGDCFLLSFPRKAPRPGGATTPFRILIDCGIIPGTTDGDKKLGQVVRQIREETGGKIDVLVATHEHADHVSGFDPRKNWFDGFTFDRVWLAWTEDPGDKVARALRADRREKLTALWLGFHQLREKLAAMGPDPSEDDNVGRALEVLSFFGIDAEDAPPERGGFGAAAKVLVEGGTAGAMKWVREGCQGERTFWKPGEMTTLDGVEGTKVYVLGPPRDLAQLHKDLPSSSKGKVAETYEDDRPKGEAAEARERAAVAEPSNAAERAFFAGAFRIGEEDDREKALRAEFGGALPFDKKYRIEWDDARGLEFFEDRYFGEGGTHDWRRIDSEWADGGASFALQLDGDTNNTSLALAFELPGGHVLLFPGDAQVGNWESWHADSKGRPLVFRDEESGKEVTAESLLNRVVLYKVGHHGSHNATLRDKGLELMTRPELSAMVPVDAFVAHVKKRWSKMPFNPLMNRLGQKIAGGRLILADTPVKPGQAPLVADGLVARFEDSSTKFDVTFEVEGQAEKVERPLFVDYVLELGPR